MMAYAIGQLVGLVLICLSLRFFEKVWVWAERERLRSMPATPVIQRFPGGAVECSNGDGGILVWIHGYDQTDEEILAAWKAERRRQKCWPEVEEWERGCSK